MHVFMQVCFALGAWIGIGDLNNALACPDRQAEIVLSQIQCNDERPFSWWHWGSSHSWREAAVKGRREGWATEMSVCTVTRRNACAGLHEPKSVFDSNKSASPGESEPVSRLALITSLISLRFPLEKVVKQTERVAHRTLGSTDGLGGSAVGPFRCCVGKFWASGTSPLRSQVPGDTDGPGCRNGGVRRCWRWRTMSSVCFPAQQAGADRLKIEVQGRFMDWA